jgi:hypothetical protein
MRDDEDTEPDTPEPQDAERDDKPDSAPTRGGSNVPNAGRDTDEDRTE